MKKGIRYILTGFFGLALAAIIVVACIAGVRSRQHIRCSGLEVAVLDSMQNSFVSKADVK